LNYLESFQTVKPNIKDGNMWSAQKSANGLQDND